MPSWGEQQVRCHYSMSRVVLARISLSVSFHLAVAVSILNAFSESGHAGAYPASNQQTTPAYRLIFGRFISAAYPTEPLLAVLVEAERLIAAESCGTGRRRAFPNSRDQPQGQQVELRSWERRRLVLAEDSARLEYFPELQRPREASAWEFRSSTVETQVVGSSSSSEMSAFHQNADRHNYTLKSLVPASSWRTCPIHNWNTRYPSYPYRSSRQTLIPSSTDRRSADPTHRQDIAARPDCVGNDNDDAGGDTACPRNSDCHHSETWLLHSQ